LVARPDGSLEALFDTSVEAPGRAAPTPVCGLGCAGCGKGRARRLPVAGAGGVAGMLVELSVTHGGLLRIAGCAFGLPLGGLLVGGLLGAAVAGESGSMLLGLAGLAAGLAWVRLNGARLVGMLELQLQSCAEAGAGTGGRS
jgi:hypothetical protein